MGLKLLADLLLSSYNCFHCQIIVLPGILVTFLALGQNTHYLQLRGGKIYFGPRILEDSVYSWLASGRKGMVEGREEDSRSSHGCQEAQRARRSREGTDTLPCCTPGDLLLLSGFHLLSTLASLSIHGLISWCV